MRARGKTQGWTGVGVEARSEHVPEPRDRPRATRGPRSRRVPRPRSPHRRAALETWPPGRRRGPGRGGGRGAARALEAFGPVRAERCDVRDRHEVGDLVGRVEHSIGPIEVLVTVAAGIIQTAPAESLVLHEFEDAIETMAWGPIHAAMTVLPHMRRRGHGRIGTVTSVGGMVSAAPAAVRDGEVRRRRLLGRPRISPER
ncbi:SDR family NAD(P)-dependent oxidoreductase [Terrabacter sp. Soil810]|uniref:SDR family NAD(P)-dependent oxidoreductase n=1 Tax=Terrabacter sp. Soil810 TaxID=1736418 RepID=UPI001F25B70E|nr:SDR family NAD(P)-dependent oxidoreductase [Terrabacter sp. Soil810]